MRRSRLLVQALIAACVVSSTGCDQWLTKPSLYNTVQVSVTRRNGEPIPDVALELYTGERPMGYGTTGLDGTFTFTRVPQGGYGVVATSWPAGYDLVENIIGGPPTNVASGLSVMHDSVPPVHFVLLKKGPGAVSVRVTGVADVAMAGLGVELYAPSGTIAKTTTDSAGRALFSNVPYGNYGVLVIRPYQYQGNYYRDFKFAFDSATAHRDGLIVEEGARDSVAFALPTCTGTLRVSVLDPAGVPVPLSTAAIYTFDTTLAVLQTGADGRLTFRGPCTPSLGVNINPAAAYFAPPGRGSDFIDGINLVNGQITDVVFHVQHR